MKTSQKLLQKIIFILSICIAFTPLIFYNDIYLGVVIAKMVYFQVFTEILLLVWAILAFQNPDFLPKKNLLNLSMLFFLLILFIANIFSINPELSFFSDLQRFDGYLMYLHLGILYLVWSTSFTNKNWTNLLIISILVGLITVIVGFNTIENITNKRIASTLGNASYYSFYLLCMVFFSLFFLLFNRKTNSKWNILGILCIGLIFFITMLKTGTRSGLVGLLAGTITFMGLFVWKSENKNQKIWVVLGGLLIILVCFFLTKGISKDFYLARLLDFSISDTTEARLGLWKTAWEGFKVHPILGWGQGNFSSIFVNHSELQTLNTDGFFDKSHNIFLEWLTASGILGLISFISIFVFANYLIWKKSNFSVIQKSILSSFFVSYWEFHFFSFDYLGSIFLVFGVLAFVSQSIDSQVVIFSFPKFIKPILLPFIFIFVGFMCYQYNFKTFQTAKNILNGLKNTDIEKTIEIAKKTYSEAVVGKTDLALAMLAMRQSVVTSDLTEDQQNQFFSTMIPMAEAELKKNPASATLPIYLADSYKCWGDTAKAVLLMDDYCTKHPKSPTHWIDYGLMLIDLKMYPKAIEAFGNLSNYHPENPVSSVYQLYAYGKMKDTLSFLTILKNLKWEDKVAYQDQIAKAFIQSDQVPLYFIYIKSCPKPELLNTNSYLQWSYIALSTNNVIEYRNAWQQYAENISFNRKLSMLEKRQLDELIGQTIEQKMEIPQAWKLIDTFK